MIKQRRIVDGIKGYNVEERVVWKNNSDTVYGDWIVILSNVSLDKAVSLLIGVNYHT